MLVTLGTKMVETYKCIRPVVCSQVQFGIITSVVNIFMLDDERTNVH